ncbi:MAG: hypothetical protein PHE55_10330, partial [Methylococcaceae bacterium]|nr:hypothetical protein [Methylococcaceae bacterium]
PCKMAVLPFCPPARGKELISLHFQTYVDTYDSIPWFMDRMDKINQRYHQDFILPFLFILSK